MAEAFPGIAWPPVARSDARTLRGFIDCIDRTQFLAPLERRARQFEQLAILARFAAAHSGHFRDRLAKARLKPDDIASPTGLRRLPVMTRRDLQLGLDRLDCRHAAPSHGPFSTSQTSGSSGEPVVVRRGAPSDAFWYAYTMREHFWHGRDVSGRLAVSRANLGTSGPTEEPDWGPPASLLGKTGPAFTMPLNAELSDLSAWLGEVDPHYLLIYPSVLSALLDEVEAGRLRLPSLRQIRTIGETLSAGLRERITSLLKVGVADAYSSQELGMIAAQCPRSGLYHAMEGVIVEILDESGKPCAPGTTGRVVLTDLHNFATPLIRYEIGDFAEAAAPCGCGRGLQTIARIRGRERNMLRLVDGRRFWPLVGFMEFREAANVEQYQVVQTSFDRLEVRLVCDPRPTPAQEDRLKAIILRALGHAFHLDLVYFDTRLPRGPGGKFEEVVCEIP